MTIPFTDLIKINHGQSIMTYRGITAGQHFFAYILCTSDKAKQMYADYNSGKIIFLLSEYGEALYQSMGTEPDEKAKEFLAEYIRKNGGSVL